jgi:dUTP pyrophosphatase
MQNLEIQIQIFENLGDIPLPSYASMGSAGMDLYAAIEDEIVLSNLERKLIPTGIAISIPQGYEGQIRPRSGMAYKHGITVVNAPGTIDSDYRGQIFVPLINLSGADFKIERGMRVAQLVIAKHETINWNIVKLLSNTERGEGGFGSTGTGKLEDKKVA